MELRSGSFSGDDDQRFKSAFAIEEGMNRLKLDVGQSPSLRVQFIFPYLHSSASNSS